MGFLYLQAKKDPGMTIGRMSYPLVMTNSLLWKLWMKMGSFLGDLYGFMMIMVDNTG